MRIFILFLLAAGCLGCGASHQPPRRVEPSSQHPAFTADNGSNALKRVAELVNMGPRDAGTEGGLQAAAWLVDMLKHMHLSAGMDIFTNDTPSGPLVCRNVLAEIPAQEKTGDWIVLISHFDTKSGIPKFVGANDSGSSTGLLLEMARILGTSPLRHDNVLLGFVDGEECRIEYGPRDGLHGSRRLARQLVHESRHVQAVIVMDMIGKPNVKVTLPMNGSPALTQMILASARDLGVSEHFGLFDGGMLDDHQPFLDAGFPAVDLIDFSFGSAHGLNDYWHTPQDTMDKLSDASLTVVGRVVLDTLGRLDSR